MSDVSESSSEDENIKEALREAADSEFLKDSLFKGDKCEVNSTESNLTEISSQKSPLSRTIFDRPNKFYNFGVSQNYRDFVAKKLREYIDRNIEFKDSIKRKRRKTKNNTMDMGIKLFSTSTNLLTNVSEEREITPNNNVSKKSSIYDNSKAHKLKCREVAVDGEFILSKEEVKGWNERQKGTVFKYKKMPNVNYEEVQVMDLPSSSSGDTNLCKLCNSCPSKYKCPRCSIPYCSVECYKSTSHLDCSEDFYKECVESEMKSRVNEPDDRKKMMDILKRFHAESSNDPLADDDDEEDIWSNIMAADEENDSDDDDAVPDLAERVKNVDMDNADELWGALTDAERQEFEAMIRNTDNDNLLPQWVPWWTHTVADKLVQDVNEIEDLEFKNKCPKIVAIVGDHQFNDPDDHIVYNLLHIFYAYVLTAMHYNGEHQSSPVEAASLFLELNHVIGDCQNFNDKTSAISSVLEAAVDHELLPDYGEPKEVTQAVRQIIMGPNKKYHTYYMTAALSDLHQLFTKVESQISNVQRPTSNSTFPRRLKSRIELKFPKLTKDCVRMCIKNVEFHLSLIEKYGSRMSAVLNN